MGGWAWLYLLLAVLVGAILAFNVFRPITVLPRITLAPGFALTGADGAVVSNEDLRGALVLYSFSYSRCADCAVTPAALADLHRQLNARVADDIDLALVTLSVDPERDTPADLAALRAAAPTGDGHVAWHWLTGDPLQTKYVVGGGFDLFYQPTGAPDDYSVSFAPRYVLVDQLGIIRAYYGGAALDVDRLLRDIDYVVTEARNSRGTAKIAYEAAHLFLCYPR